MRWTLTLVSMSTRRMRNSWRGRNGLPAGSLLKYILRNTVITPVTPVLTPRRPVPFRQYRSPPTRNQVEWPPPHQPGKIPTTHSPSGFNPAVCHTGGTGDTKADPGMQLPVSPRCTAEVRQPDNAFDPFGGGTGLPQPVLPKGFGLTPD